MKKFQVPCDFGGTKSPVTLYIGNPETKHHPIAFQVDWLSKERGGNVPSEVMNSLEKLMSIANRNNVLLEDLCEYALYSATANTDDSEKKEPTAEQTNEQTAELSPPSEEDQIRVAKASMEVAAEKVPTEKANNAN